LLEQVYRSLPPHDDVIWHLAKTSRRPPLTHPFLATDPRIRLYEIDCDDTDIVTKRNTMFAHITDGYFFLLDDDTICLGEMYQVYREFSARGFSGMIVGASTVSAARQPSLDPALNRIDAGAVICCASVLRVVHWEWSAAYARDRYFWSRCFAHFGNARTVVVPRTISAYNAMGPLVRVRKRILSRVIAWDIYNPWLARAYLLAAGLRHHVRTRRATS